MRLGVYSNPDCDLHHGYSVLSEKPSRLASVRAEFKELELEILPSRPMNPKFLELAHHAYYIEHVKALSTKRSAGQLGDLCASTNSPYLQYYLRPMEGSYKAAIAAAGDVHNAVRDVIFDRLDRAFCAIRPPGHHAGPGKGEGFCFFNNVAIGALTAATAGARVVIIDFDHHHGNGTQAIVEQRGKDQVLLVSSFLEGCKYARGLENKPAGKNIVTIPIPRDSEFDSVKLLYEAQAIPKIIAFKPDLIMISAGFDMHKDDPLSGIKLKSEDYDPLTSMLVKAANETCTGRIVSVLEGGYELQALKDSVRHHLNALQR